jgi:hypothetical protein
MEKFIVLTHQDGGGRVIINLRHLKAVVEHEGKTYVAINDGTPETVLETMDDIVARIEANKGNVI